MDLDLLNLIPDEILNLIFCNIKPTIKYSLNKTYFYKYYKYRFAFINYRFLFYKSNIKKHDFFYIKDFNYLKFLIKKDSKICLQHIIDNKLKYDDKKYIFKNEIKFENIEYDNTIIFIYNFSKKYNSILIYNYIVNFIKINNLTHLIKKQHKTKSKNNNKQKKWKI